MSASTEVEEIIEARLRELDEQLRPLVELEGERARLQRALTALQEAPASDGGDASVATSATRGPVQRQGRKATQPRARRRGRAARSSERAARGSNLEAILEHVAAHPGATASDLAAATGISRGVIYSAVSRLTAAERLRRDPLPDGQVAYHLP